MSSSRRVGQAGGSGLIVALAMPRGAHCARPRRPTKIDVQFRIVVRPRGLDAPYTWRGVTLLELILALALAVIVMAAIGWALQLHLRAFDTRRTDVEEAQLARAVLKLVGDDLRSALALNAVNFTEAARLATGDDLEDIDGGDAGTGGAGGVAGKEEEEEAEQPADLTADLTPSTIPGLYGNATQLLVDVSRLPRIEDFDVTAGASDIPSDVKTVAYYLENPAQVALRRDAGAPDNGGLVRRALDRSVTQWAATSGDASQLAAQGEIIAPEIVALEFRYFDGTTWLAEWDTQANGGLPQAVEVVIAIGTSDDALAATARDSTLPVSAAGGTKVYRQIIRIPAAAPLKEELEVDESQ